jgi:hypothetical protein
MDYALNTPVKRNLYVPEKIENPEALKEQPIKPTEVDQSQRAMPWLFNNPQQGAIFPVKPQAVKIEKKK